MSGIEALSLSLSLSNLTTRRALWTNGEFALSGRGFEVI